MADTDRITVCFTLGNRARRWSDIEWLREDDIEREPSRFTGGRNSWIAQTYLRLRAALVERGHRVRVSSRFHDGTIAVAHRDDANRFANGAHRAHLVIVRADRPPVCASDHVIAQNVVGADHGEYFVPLWPQPGIVPRLDSRGDRVVRLAYAGRVGASPGWFYADEFHRALRERGVVFDIRQRDWNDYRNVDVAIAARVAAPGMLAVKPATKLYNAWLAGVPMLAAPEPAYRELRRSPLDYIEIHGPDDVLHAIDRLRAEPWLYRAMIANGRERGRDFGVDAIRARWLALFDRVFVPAFLDHRPTLASRRLWFIREMARQKIHAKAFRARNGWTLLRLVHAQRTTLSAAAKSAGGASRIRSRAA